MTNTTKLPAAVVDIIEGNINPQSISHAYILGIKEGRTLLTATPNLDRTDMRDMRDILDNITSTLKRGFSGDVADMLRGERDFWKNQLRSVRT